jgi:hypothetical protein
VVHIRDAAPHRSRTQINKTLTLLRTCRAFFGLVDDGCFHCEDCAFVSGIVPESLLNLSNGFNLSIAKLLAKFNAVMLLNSFCHFAITNNPPSTHNTYTIIDRLPATDAFCRRETIHAFA